MPTLLQDQHYEGCVHRNMLRFVKRWFHLYFRYTNSKHCLFTAVVKGPMPEQMMFQHTQ